ncbi:xanthine dehydrogenase family protein molybdopterin-binding subunit [Methylobacterium sp. J-067]|uniref:xanthine dehydrogenase family protein molybdopterin-binding subunit n=1 Tax=Methylobacterium sp. J-067 TaxID=2836648 RepID=UPI001FB889B1|nr:xanthine dehydrogenase family protein molybdopterin-binding subunit [Methylobacterium sp. J-067]MCJ2026944.1 xanthine dehydrogenase family protein molybdopterin-binding subunit [Methylobacterium sp. J-067]
MSAATDSPGRTRYIGQGLPRPGAKRLLAGRGRYTDDVVLPRMLHAAFLRSPYAHARLGAIETADAAAMPGVHAVLTGADFAKICTPWTGTLSHFKGMRSAPQMPLPANKVVWAGQPVVMVVAESRAEAEDALELIGIDFEELEPVVGLDAARAPDAPRIDADTADNVLFRTRIEAGETARAFTGARSVEVDLRFGRHTAVTMEPRSLVADYDPAEERLTVHQSTQTPYQFQDIYARHFRLSEARVRVIAPDVGGSFGMKLHLYHEDMAVVGASLLLKRPVKFTADRMEAFASDIHARDHRVRARLAFDGDGRMRAIEVDDVTGVGPFSAYPRTSAVEGNQVVRLIGAPYRLSDYRADLTVLAQNKVQMSQYRAVGHPIACAVTERLVDLVAGELGLDPFEIRRRNYVTDDMYPHKTPSGYTFEKLSLAVCLDRLHELMDYPALRAEQAALREKGIHRGIGIATYVEITNPTPAFYGVGGAHISAQDGCVVKLTPAGDVACAISITEQGQGSEAIVGQIVAEGVGLDRDRVRVLTGDTETTPSGGATWACRGAGIGGETALQAARKLKARILEIAAAILQAEAGSLDIREGAVTDADGSPRMTLTEVANLAYYRSDLLPPGVSPALTVAHHFAPRGYPFAFTNGIHGSLVEVDTETGLVRILKHWVVEDCGRVINPLLVDEQIRGGVVQGLGAAFFEECRYSETGQLLNGSMTDYLVPMACEMPDIVIRHVETPTKDTELGAKGCGEAGTAASSGAALNAVNDALLPFGAAISQLPMTPERILRALGMI